MLKSRFVATENELNRIKVKMFQNIKFIDRTRARFILPQNDKRDREIDQTKKFSLGWRRYTHAAVWWKCREDLFNVSFAVRRSTSRKRSVIERKWTFTSAQNVSIGIKHFMDHWTAPKLNMKKKKKRRKRNLYSIDKPNIIKLSSMRDNVNTRHSCAFVRRIWIETKTHSKIPSSSTAVRLHFKPIRHMTLHLCRSRYLTHCNRMTGHTDGLEFIVTIWSLANKRRLHQPSRDGTQLKHKNRTKS